MSRSYAKQYSVTIAGLCQFICHLQAHGFWPLRASELLLGLQVTGQRKLWSGLYALAFGLIVLLWLLKSAYNVTVLKKRQKRSYSRQNLKDEGAPSRSSSDEMDRSRAKVGV